MLNMLRLCRLYYTIPMALTFSLTVYYARGGQMAGQWVSLWWATGALAMVIAAAYVLNDVLDVYVDRYNAPRRPIASGRIRPGPAAAVAMILLVGGLVVAVWRTPLIFAGVLAAVAAGLMVYDLHSKRLGVAKQLAVAGLMTSIYPLAIAHAGGVFGPRAWTLLPFAAWMFLSSWAYELLKDIRNRKGDAYAVGKTNRLQRHPRFWWDVSSWLIVLGGLAVLLPGALGCQWVYRAGSAAVMAVVVLIVASKKCRNRIVLIYIEFVLVGAAAILDIIICGF